MATLAASFQLQCRSTFVRMDLYTYPIGNGLNQAVSGAIGIASLVSMKADQRKRGRVAPAERMELLANLTPAQIADLGWKHPNFKLEPVGVL